MSSQTITVPDIGGAEGVEVIEVCVAVGDAVAQEQSLVVLETDKASMEVPCTHAGTITEINVQVGQKVSEGDVICALTADSGADSVTSEPAASAEPVAAAAPAPTATASSDNSSQSTSQAVVPEGVENAEVIEVSIAEGADLSEGDTVAVLETDKATVEVPATAAGKVLRVVIVVGDTLSSGDVVAELQGQPNTVPEASKPAAAPAAEAVPRAVPGAAPTSAAPAKAASPAAPAPVDSTANNSTNSSATDVYAGPAVRTHARLLGVDLAEIKPTGPRGRIVKEDVDNFVKQIVQNKNRHQSGGSLAEGAGIPPMPAVDFTKFGEIDTQPMSKIQKLTAFNMHRNWLHIPAVTQFDDADITDLEAFRKGLKAEAEKRGVKLTPLPFLLKAVAAALQAEPKFNSSLGADGESIVYKKYCHIGIAADTPNGLLVAVLRDVDKKGLWQLAQEATELIGKARAGKLSPSEMQGSCFTISSLGAMGGKGFTPIVNAPEVGILGVSKAEMKPVWNGAEFVPRNMLPLSLSYDHRVINGADCGRFFTYLVSVLSDVRRILL